MKHNLVCNCINLRKASNNITRIYNAALANLGLKITQFSTLRIIEKFRKATISDLSYNLNLDRTTVLRNIEKLIKMNLVSYKYENNNKNKTIQLTAVGKNKLRKATIIWKETEFQYNKVLDIKNYEEFSSLIAKISKINI